MDIEKLLSRAGDEISVRRAFGSAIEQDGTLIIPVAWVAGGGGAGDSGTPAAKDASGTGSGGGFGGMTWPLGVYEVKDGRVRWVPAVDTTRIALAALAIFRAVVKLRTVRQVKALRRTPSSN